MNGVELHDWVQDIHDMHTKFGVREAVAKLDDEKLRKFLEFRLLFLREELVEAFKAAGYDVKFDVQTSGPAKPEDMEHVVDALIDLCVVAIGTMDAFQVDAYEAWNRVHEKNMQKEVGVKPNRPNPLGLPDLIKPAGWTSPTHADNVGLLKRVAK
jgi:predicted HAD superfamily Cof-like phosphohydrolase